MTSPAPSDPSESSNETICAIATPAGHAAIGIVRVSGPDAFAIVQPIFTGHGRLADFASHTVHYSRVRNPENGEIIDEALFLVMKGPRSYTGESMVEIQAHGNPLVLQQIVAALMAQGARLAAPGEFTRRAFLSGRIDLAQAEAVMEVIAAQSDTHRIWALDQLKGNLSTAIGDLRERLLATLSQVEASIDFVEQGVTVYKPAEMVAEVAAVQAAVRALLASYHDGRAVREGRTVVIAGRPNVGKSSLLNRLVGEARAIVTPQPGTTRDLVDAWVRWGDLALKIVDTAGIRESHDPIEQEGVRRGQEAIRAADLVLLVLDASEPLLADDLSWMTAIDEEAAARGGRVLVTLNKSDLPRRIDLTALPDPAVSISTVTGAGLDDLQRAIANALKMAPEKERPLVALLRHHDALTRADHALERAVAAAAEGQKTASWEFLAVDLREAADLLGEIIGASPVVDDALLDRIFNQFCIGK